MKHRKILYLLLVCVLAFCLLGVTAAADDGATEYNLWVGGVRVTSDNASDVLKDGKVRFAVENGENILYLNGTTITDAPVVVGVGPGFTAGSDCHAVVETMRGHTLGRVIYQGSALPDSKIPGLIGGFAGERVLRAPADGTFHGALRIGSLVETGDIAGYVGDAPMRCTIMLFRRGLNHTEWS